MKLFMRICAAGMLAAIPALAVAQTAPGTIEKGSFRFAYDERGISGLANPHDPFGAMLMPSAAPGGRGQGGATGRGGGAATLGLSLSYRAGNGEWTTLTTRGPKWTASPETGVVTYANDSSNVPLKVAETYRTDGNVLDWTIDVESTGKTAVQIGDLGINIPVVGPSG